MRRILNQCANAAAKSSMAENKWAREYLRALFGPSQSVTTDDDREIHAIGPVPVIDDPLLELRFLRQGGMSAVDCIKLAVPLLEGCTDQTPIELVAELVETVETCNEQLRYNKESLPALEQAIKDDPKNGEQIAHLGFALLALHRRKEALSAFTKALEYPDTICIHCYRDCLVNIGWDHYLRREYEEALGWFEHASKLSEPSDEHDGRAVSNTQVPYKLALENILLALAKMGRLTEAAARLEEYQFHFGRLPRYESEALIKLGLEADVVYLRSRIEDARRVK